MRFGGGGGRSLLVWSALALGAGACRQMVMLEQPADAGGDGSGSAGGLPSWLAGCPRLQSSIRYPEVVIALDRSGAMLDPLGGSNDPALSLAQEDLLNLVAAYLQTVRFGYVDFPDPSCTTNGGCCASDLIPPKLLNFTPIQMAMTRPCPPSMPGGCFPDVRPTGDALYKSRLTYSQLVDQDRHSRYVLLVTAADPSCSAFGSSGACNDAMNEVTNLVNMNNTVFTYVVGVGNNLSSTTCLGRLAMQGGSRMFQATFPGDLSDTLASIIQNIARGDNCEVVLTSGPPPDPSKVQVVLNNTSLVPNDPVNGWDFDDHSNNTVIRLHGSACQQLLATPGPDSPDVQVISSAVCTKAH